MILSATIHDGYRHCATAEQVDELIGEVMTTLDGGDPRRPLVGGEIAALYFADRPLTADTFSEPPFTWTAIHELVVAVNLTTGFGTLRWDTEFVTSNPNPPVDPAVLGDPFAPSWYHPRYAIPLAAIESAVREFCAGEGLRPDTVTWSADGAHHDRLYLGADEYLAAAASSP